MTQLILGLGNKARHGKDTFAAAIERHYAAQEAAAIKYGLRTYTRVTLQRLAFADALYKEVNDFLKSSYGREFLYGQKRLPIDVEFDLPDWVQPDPKAEVSARAPYGKHSKLLQWWGTEYRRTKTPSYWVDRWKAAINPKANIVLTTDMRFLNEAAAVKSLGGYTVQVNRKNVDGTPFVDPSRDRNHPSEVELDNYNFDYQITVKTGDIALLDEWATTLVYYLRGREKK